MSEIFFFLGEGQSTLLKRGEYKKGSFIKQRDGGIRTPWKLSPVHQSTKSYSIEHLVKLDIAGQQSGCQKACMNNTPSY